MRLTDDDTKKLDYIRQRLDTGKAQVLRLALRHFFAHVYGPSFCQGCGGPLP